MTLKPIVDYVDEQPWIINQVHHFNAPMIIRTPTRNNVDIYQENIMGESLTLN